jgi:hypothetical protein
MMLKQSLLLNQSYKMVSHTDMEEQYMLEVLVFFLLLEHKFVLK